MFMATIEIRVNGATSFEIVDHKGKILDNIGMFPGQPEGMPPGRFYLVKDLETGACGSRGRMLGTSQTIDEAQWVSYSLAKDQASHLLATLGGGNLIDNTPYSGKNNPYQEEVDLLTPRLRVLRNNSN
jgi:hypothetical protein